MALEPQGAQNLPLDPSQEPALNIPPQPTQPPRPTAAPFTPAATSPNQNGPQPYKPMPQPVTPPQPVKPSYQAPQPTTAPVQPSTPTPVRTMKSDINSLEGRLAATNNPSFDADEPVFTPETTNNLDTPVDEIIAAQKRKSRLLWVIGAVVIIIVFVVIGFFVLQPKTETAPIDTTPTDTTPTDTTPTTETLKHSSRFVVAPASTIAVTVSTAPTREEIVGALVREGGRAGVGLTEITFADSNGNQIAASAFLGALATNFPDAKMAGAVFTEDFTAFIYKDASGIWPGYVLNQKQGSTTSAVQQWLTALEASNLADFFTVSPGAFKGFRNGTIGTIPDRYNPGSTVNASFGYFAHNSTVLIATSFNGMKEAVKLLGF